MSRKDSKIVRADSVKKPDGALWYNMLRRAASRVLALAGLRWRRHPTSYPAVKTGQGSYSLAYLLQIERSR